MDSKYHKIVLQSQTQFREILAWRIALLLLVIFCLIGCNKTISNVTYLDSNWNPQYFVYSARIVGTDFTWNQGGSVEAILDIDVGVATKSKIIGFYVLDISRDRYEKGPSIFLKSNAIAKNKLVDIILVDIALIEALPIEQVSSNNLWPSEAKGITVQPDERNSIRLKIRLKESAVKGDMIAVAFPDAVHEPGQGISVGIEAW